jgi:hypothetical protein
MVIGAAVLDCHSSELGTGHAAGGVGVFAVGVTCERMNRPATMGSSAPAAIIWVVVRR